MRVLAISGSLRAASLNSMLRRALLRIAPQSVHIDLYREIGRLPLFNPDLEPSDPPPVANLRKRIIDADGGGIVHAVPLLGSGLEEGTLIEHQGMRGAMLRALQELQCAVSSGGSRGGPSFSID